MTFKEKLQDVYLDWVNNFLSVECFAEYYGLTVEQATKFISLGHSVHESIVAEYKYLHSK